ncbi:DapH/DapD/GlmU-related protein [Bordetella avium]|uniref:O-acyltransferase n=1 Tax=Bordetella avium (strain 197N) TaxID=360910 RepID=Q2KUH1_BORA1|nr:DapH/DapD/GlmU-related protein [Bordetella avium]RIQ15414.1 hypothetical protein D0432_04660 [Bordetella avium]RIQ38476.1 hypothetical protein D0848_07585 [Bordetella avium]RIQ43015.1 hypothetical protein D0847_07565 [Bordetella avium]RIQ44050.1 hypothetical protein D0846_08375 [Bordetella avium]RIQ53035.1 hypothetical protein D0845_00950 [Bordetella avium]
MSELMNVVFADPYLDSLASAYVQRHFPQARIWSLERDALGSFDTAELEAELSGKPCLLFAGPGFAGRLRIDIFSRLLRAGLKLLPVIFDAAMCAPETVVGVGSLIYPNSIVDSGVTIGYNTLIGPNAIIEAGCSIGNHCFIGANTILRTGTRVDNFVYLAEGCDVGGPSGFKADEPARLKIERGVIVMDATRIRESLSSSVMIDAAVGDVIRVFR